jgi:hypothetical protein
MNHTTLSLVFALAAAIGSYIFVAPQSAAAQDFNTNNSASQSGTQTGTATGGAGGSFDLWFSGSNFCIFFCNAPGGDATVSQTICQQAAQSGAFGNSTNDISEC